MNVATANTPTRILLTEDDPINQEVATIMLESMGHKVEVAETGAMALEALENGNQFDLILMDCQMPVMDGLDATKAIRAQGIKTPIVALTASETELDKQNCIDAGMNDYLAKPIHQPDLMRVIQQWTSQT